MITVPGDSDLETCRLLIERLQDNLDQVLHRPTTGLGFIVATGSSLSRLTPLLVSQKLSVKWCFLDCKSHSIQLLSSHHLIHTQNLAVFQVQLLTASTGSTGLRYDQVQFPDLA